jgi:hypothetical protein
MISKEAINQVIDELYELIGQINYGETSHIEVYWSGLADSLFKLNINNWEKPDYTNWPSEILRSMGELVSDDLVELVDKMEGLSAARGSDGSLDEEDLEELQSLSVDLEDLFLKFINKISNANGN